MVLTMNVKSGLVHRSTLWRLECYLRRSRPIHTKNAHNCQIV